jgi:hypothetical protein
MSRVKEVDVSRMIGSGFGTTTWEGMTAVELLHRNCRHSITILTLFIEERSFNYFSLMKATLACNLG